MQAQPKSATFKPKLAPSFKPDPFSLCLCVSLSLLHSLVRWVSQNHLSPATCHLSHLIGNLHLPHPDSLYHFPSQHLHFSSSSLSLHTTPTLFCFLTRFSCFFHTCVLSTGSIPTPRPSYTTHTLLTLTHRAYAHKQQPNINQPSLIITWLSTFSQTKHCNNYVSASVGKPWRTPTRPLSHPP